MEEEEEVWAKEEEEKEEVWEEEKGMDVKSKETKSRNKVGWSVRRNLISLKMLKCN